MQAAGEGEARRAEAHGRLRRRGMLAGAAALLGGVVAKLAAATRVEAGHGGAGDGTFHLEQVNNQAAAGDETVSTITTRTTLVGNLGGIALRVKNLGLGGASIEAIAGPGGSMPGFSTVGGTAVTGTGGSLAGTGVRGTGGDSSSGTGGRGVVGVGGSGGTGIGGAGVVGFGATGATNDGPGVRGNRAAGIGVLGNASLVNEDVPLATSGVYGLGGGQIGVTGQSNSNYGVYGTSTSGVGVYGQSGPQAGVLGNSTNNVGVYGLSANNHGVLGQAAGGGLGVYGIGNSNYGVYGVSASSYAVVGNSPSNVGVYGTSSASAGVLGNSTSYYGVYGISNSSVGVFGTTTSGYAGLFVGPVVVQGDFTVTGGAKSAAVPHPDGSLRRLYAVEAPESWFEDFGEGRLAGGRADVRLDRDFAAVVRGEEYHVFLTPRGDCKGLYVASQTPAGFEVRELQGGTSSLEFSYRVVARRRDIAGPRLARVQMPPPARALPPAPRPVTEPAPPVVPGSQDNAAARSRR